MKRVHAITNLTKACAPYLVVWALYYAWVESFATWWTATPDNVRLFSETLRNILMSVTLMTTATLICFFKRSWFVSGARIGAAALAVTAGASLFLLPDSWRLYTAPLQAMAMGLVCVSVLVPFVFILNNSEKLYGMVFGSVAANLFSLLCRAEMAESLLGRGSSFIILLAALAAIPLFKKQDLSAGDLVLPIRENRKVAYFSLLINCFFAVFVKGVGKLMLDNMFAVTGTNPYAWEFVGGIVGCVVCLVIFAFVRGSLFTVWNVTFSAFLLSAFCCAFADDVASFSACAALLIGFSSNIGMITLYYNMGVICRKYRNPQHLRLVLWFGLFGGGGSVLLNLATDLAHDMTVVFVLAGIGVLVSLAYFIVSPLLFRTYFADEWVEDSETPNADGRFEAMLQQMGLTTREGQICRLLLDGMTMRQISATLGIAQGTVNTHCTSLYRKAGIQSKIELVKLLQDAYHL